MRTPFAFQPEDLAALLALEWAEPADMADIDAIHEILLRRSDLVRSDPVRSDPVRSDPVRSDPVRSDPVRRDPGMTDVPPSGRAALHLVPDLGS